MKKPKFNKQTPQSDPNKQGGKEDECKVRGDIHIRGEIETSLAPSLVRERKAEREEDKSKDRNSYIVSVITLVAVMCYAFLTFWQGCMTREIITDARKSERPYIWVTPAGIGNPEFIPNTLDPGTGQIAWTLHYTAYGRSPAYDVLCYPFMKVGVGQPFQESYGFSKVERGEGVPMPPNADYFVTVFSNPGITSDEYSRLIKLDHAISIRFHIEYADSYGGKYETGVGLRKPAKNAVEFCPEGNYIR